MSSLYAPDGQRIGEQSEQAQAARVMQVQMWNLIIYLREELMKVVDRTNGALEKMSDLPEHKFEVRTMRELNEIGIKAAYNEVVVGFVNELRIKVLFEFCQRLVANAKELDEKAAEFILTLIEDTLKEFDETPEEKVVEEPVSA